MARVVLAQSLLFVLRLKAQRLDALLQLASQLSSRSPPFIGDDRAIASWTFEFRLCRRGRLPFRVGPNTANSERKTNAEIGVMSCSYSSRRADRSDALGHSVHSVTLEECTELFGLWSSADRLRR
jgi:hypothetical protein